MYSSHSHSSINKLDIRPKELMAFSTSKNDFSWKSSNILIYRDANLYWLLSPQCPAYRPQKRGRSQLRHHKKQSVRFHLTDMIKLTSKTILYLLCFFRQLLQEAARIYGFIAIFGSAIGICINMTIFVGRSSLWWEMFRKYWRPRQHSPYIQFISAWIPFFDPFATCPTLFSSKIVKT